MVGSVDDSKPLLGKWLEITKHPLEPRKKSGYAGYMLGMKSYPIAIMINHDIGIPIKQPVQCTMESKRVFFVADLITGVNKKPNKPMYKAIL